ncbi:UNVERIFIED_CONTAM: hypothetical protein GTU68_016829, partial [Idotea baltica]|nr:hypothetical protein [Idotea baltica]
MGLKVDPISQVKVAFIGLGNRGPGHVKHINALYPKAKITAICDVRENKAQEMADFLKKEKQTPAVYTGKEEGWKEMLQRDDIDLVIIATPWKNHVPMCVYAMQQGKHVAVEVPAAVTLEECWALVNTAEETRRNCMMMENVCYGNEELWILNMVEKGIFGTLTHAEAAYIHNLRNSLFSKDQYYNMWRIRHHMENDGNLYPTHGLGPVAQYMNIARGDRFDHLVSMSSLQASLEEHSLTVESDNEFYNRKDFAHGDMNNCLIKTAKGRTILVQHDVVTPRPYSRINALGGTKAYHEGYPSRLSLHDQGHEWLDETTYKEMRKKYDHPIWTTLKDAIAKNGGHGGMDFVLNYRMIDCLNRGLPLDMDVYDGADWSVVTPLSKVS